MAENRKDVISSLDRIIGLIKTDTKDIPAAEKKRMVSETLDQFQNYVSPGWLKYRKSVSSDSAEGAVLEWQDGGAYCYITPGDLQYCFFTNGGAEAVEMALKLSRIATGGRWFISAVGGFHGKSMGAVSVCGKSTYRQPYGPMVQQVQHVRYGVADDIRQAISNLQAVGEKVAAVILEPIQGEAGVIVPPDGYLRAVRRICDETGVALIFDEIQTGMGRTGTVWRCEHEVRGVGLMLAVEFRTQELGYETAKGLFARRVMTAGTLVNAKTIRFEPTAEISEEDISEVISRLDEALADTRLRCGPDMRKSGAAPRQARDSARRSVSGASAFFRPQAIQREQGRANKL